MKEVSNKPLNFGKILRFIFFSAEWIFSLSFNLLSINSLNLSGMRVFAKVFDISEELINVSDKFPRRSFSIFNIRLILFDNAVLQGQSQESSLPTSLFRRARIFFLHYHSQIPINIKKTKSEALLSCHYWGHLRQSLHWRSSLEVNKVCLDRWVIDTLQPLIWQQLIILIYAYLFDYSSPLSFY